MHMIIKGTVYVACSPILIPVLIIKGTATYVLREAFPNAQMFAVRADRFERCLLCGSRDYIGRGHTEIVVRYDTRWAKQLFDCARCGCRQLLARKVNERTWSHFAAESLTGGMM